MAEFTREQAWVLLTQYNKENFHLKHAETVESVMRWFAVQLGYDEEADFWALVGLLHDLDFEMYPQEHCRKQQELMREHGLPERLIRATASHGYASTVEIEPEHEMEKVLYAVDELTGLIGAVALMRPSKSMMDLEVKSVKKKYKSANFAAGCSREVIERGAAMLGWELEYLIQKTILALQAYEVSQATSNDTSADSSSYQQKYTVLKRYLSELGSVVVAFSGGVDSTFLLKTARDVLGERVIAVTARSCSFPERELNEARAFCEQEGILHIICDSEELDIEGFSQNPVNRCYLCKSELFTKIWAVAREHGIPHVAEGSNMDDNGDYRPGLVAVSEQDVKSPLRYAELSKEEIRALSRELGIATWSKQSFACLSSRFPYGESITRERLSMVDQAEQVLLDLGLHQVRVRMHGNLARIETDENGFAILADRQNRESIYSDFKRIGFLYISVDLLGYRTGSMNETLKK